MDRLEERSNNAAAVLHQGPSWPWMGVGEKKLPPTTQLPLQQRTSWNKEANVQEPTIMQREGVLERTEKYEKSAQIAEIGTIAQIVAVLNFLHSFR